MHYIVLSLAGLVAAFVAAVIPLELLFYLTVALYFLGPDVIPPIAEFSEFTLRVVDIPLGFLVVRVLLSMLLSKSAGLPRVLVPIALFIAYIGLSLFLVAGSYPDHTTASVASYARLVQTTLFVPLGYVVLRRPERIQRFLRLFVVLAVGTVLVMVMRMLFSQPLTGVPLEGFRGVGLLTTNTIGLISGLLLVLVVVAGRLIRLRWLGAAFAILGLALTRSMAASFATLVVLGLYWGLRSTRLGSLRLFRVTLSLTVACVVLAALGLWLRPIDMRGLFALSGGSFVERFYLMSAGLAMFLRRPFLGWGWQVSSITEAIQDPITQAYMPVKFSDELTSHFAASFPGGTSVHNLYVQVLVDLGLAGFLLLLVVIGWAWRTALRILRRYPATSMVHAQAQFFALGLLVILLWWNSSALFPGQVETVLTMVFLGGLSSFSAGSRTIEPSS